MDENDSWITTMLLSGYAQGPKFSTYDTLLAWDNTNQRPHIRRLFDGEHCIFLQPTHFNLLQVKMVLVQIIQLMISMICLFDAYVCKM